MRSLPKTSEIDHKTSKDWSEVFRRLTKLTEDSRRLPKSSEGLQSSPENFRRWSEVFGRFPTRSTRRIKKVSEVQPKSLRYPTLDRRASEVSFTNEKRWKSSPQRLCGCPGHVREKGTRDEPNNHLDKWLSGKGWRARFINRPMPLLTKHEQCTWSSLGNLENFAIAPSIHKLVPLTIYSFHWIIETLVLISGQNLNGLPCQTEIEGNLCLAGSLGKRLSTEWSLYSQVIDCGIEEATVKKTDGRIYFNKA